MFGRPSGKFFVEVFIILRYQFSDASYNKDVFCGKGPETTVRQTLPPPLSRGLVVTHHFLSSLFT